MIMQRPENDDAFGPTFDPTDLLNLSIESDLVPGLLYRGVPQDYRRRDLRHKSFRIDGAAPVEVTIQGSTRNPARRANREAVASEFYFG